MMTFPQLSSFFKEHTYEKSLLILFDVGMTKWGAPSWNVLGQIIMWWNYHTHFYIKQISDSFWCSRCALKDFKGRSLYVYDQWYHWQLRTSRSWGTHHWSVIYIWGRHHLFISIISGTCRRCTEILRGLPTSLVDNTNDDYVGLATAYT